MANQEHLDILKQGVEAWNQWRKSHLSIVPDLHWADLREANLSGAILSGVDLRRANLRRANLHRADLSGTFSEEEAIRATDVLIGTDGAVKRLEQADLSEADLWQADLSHAHLRGVPLRGANLSEADLSLADLSLADLSGANLYRARLLGAELGQAKLTGANLHEADLYQANLNSADLSHIDLRDADLQGAQLHMASLNGANLSGANLKGAILVKTNLANTNLTGCSIYGISAWNVQLKDAIQSNLIITDDAESTITVDNLEVAQFIYLLLTNKKIRDVINTITSKVVLILGRFTPERKAVLDELREALRRYNYLPILFDFEKPSSRDFTETVRTLAHLARFIIADLTDPSSIPQELQAIVPTLAVPVQPLLQETHKEYAMFVDFRVYPWMLPVYFYRDEASLLASLQEHVIEPAEQKAKELERR